MKLSPTLQETARETSYGKPCFVLHRKIAISAAVILAAAIALAPSSARAASTSWLATAVDNNWANGANWGAGAAPGILNPSSNNVSTGDVATFNNPLSSGTIGGATNPIVNDAGRMISSLIFDTANVGAYTIGFTGTTALLIRNAGSVTMTGSVTVAEVVNAPITIRQNSSTNGTFSFINNAAPPSATLTLGGAINNGNGRPTSITLSGSNTGNNIISGVITQASGSQNVPLITKTGVGTWILSGSNTFTGTAVTTLNAANGVQVNAGVLVLENNNALGTTTSVNNYINNGGTLELNSSSVNGSITLHDSLTLQLNSGGTIRSSGTNATNSKINLSAAALVSATLSTVNASDVFTIGNGPNDFTGGAIDTVVHIAGPGTILLSNSSNYAGIVSVDTGTLQLGANTALGTGGVAVAGGAKMQTLGNSPTVTALTGSGTVENGGATDSTLTASIASGTNSFSGVLQNGSTGLLALTKTGAGTLTLTGNNTHTGATTVSNGTLNLTGVLGSTAVSATSGGVLAGSGTIAGTVKIANNSAISPGDGGSGTVGTLTVGSLTLDAGSQLNYDITSTAVLDQIKVTTSGGLTINGGQVNINGGATNFTTNGVYNLIGFSGVLSGSAGALTVNANNQNTTTNSYTFGTSGGFVTLTIASTGAVTNFWNVNGNGNWSSGPSWTTGTTPNAVGAFAAFGGGGTEITAPRTITVDGSYTVGTLALNNGTNAYTIASGTGGNLTLNNGATGSFVTDTAGSHTISVPLTTTTNGVTLNVVAAPDTLTVSGPVGGNGLVTKAGNGTLALSGSNNYTSGTIINNGTVAINSADSLGDVSGTATINAGTLRSTANIVTARNFNLGSVTSTISVNAATSYTLNGVVADGGSAGTLNKAGGGLLVLNGSNSYTGGTVINSGTVAINTVDSLGNLSGGLTINNGALETTANIITSRNVTLGDANSTISVDPSTTYTVNGTLSGTGSLNKTGAGTLTLTAANNYSGNTILTDGIISVGNGGTTGALGSGTAVFQGGTLTNSYNTNNSYTFAQSIFVASGQTGTINMGNRMSLNGSVSGSGTLNVNLNTSATRDDFNNTWTGFTGQVNIAGNGTARLLNNGGSFNVGSFANSSVDISGSAILQPSNNSGGNTYSFGALSGSSATAGFTTPSQGGATTLSVGALNTSTTFAGILPGSTNLIKTGTGTLTLTGTANSHVLTTINGGTLSVSADANLGSTGSASILNINNGSKLALTEDLSSNRQINLGPAAGSVQADGNLISAEINVATGKLATWTGQILGTNATSRLMVTGSGTLFLNNVGQFGQALNAFSGGIYIHGGTVLTGSGPQFADSVLTADQGGKLISNQNGAFNANVLIGTGGHVRATTEADKAVWRNGQISNVNNVTNFGGLSYEGTGKQGLGGNNLFGGTGMSVTIGTGFTLGVSRDFNFGNASNVININGGTLSVEHGARFNEGTAALEALSADLTTGRAINITGTATINVTDQADSRNAAIAATLNGTAAQMTANGIVSGSGGLTKMGVGTLTLSATNTYTGPTNVNAGTVVVAGSISGSVLTTATASGILAGNGTVGALVVANGGTVSPGTSVGTMNVSDTAGFRAGGNYKLELKTDGSGGAGQAGIDWDRLVISGNLDISLLSSGSPFVLTLRTLNASDAAGPLATFNSGVNHTWASIVSATGFTGTFASNLFSINTVGFQNTFGGSFSVARNGNDLDLLYVAPEPGTSAMLVSGLGVLIAFQRFRRRDRKI